MSSRPQSREAGGRLEKRGAEESRMGDSAREGQC